MPTKFNMIDYSELFSLVKISNAPIITSCQSKGIPRGKLFVLDSLSPLILDHRTPRKHPNRPMKPVKNRLELGEFDHLKKGRVYKLSLSKNQNIPYILYKNPELMPKDRIGTVSHGSIVIYLETIESDSGLFHKLVVGDQVGYVFCNNAGLRLKRITSRMLRRMEANVEESKDERETEES